MKTITLPNETLLSEISDLLSEGKSVSLKVKGNSMLPFIIGGRDHVILKQKYIYKVRDIVLAEISPSNYVLHRIIEINDSQITLMGDGNISGTEQCIEENIYGYLVSINRNNKLIDCNKKNKRVKAYIWFKLLPIRRYLLAIYRRII